MDDKLCFPTQEKKKKKSPPCEFKTPDGESGTGGEPAVQQRADLYSQSRLKNGKKERKYHPGFFSGA